MKINVVILNDKELESKYTNYKHQLNQLTSVPYDDSTTLNLIKELKKQTIEFDRILKENYAQDITQFTEDYYAENISDVTAENLLMNGLYKKDEIMKIVEDSKGFLSDEIYDFFITITNKINKDEKILCWNL